MTEAGKLFCSESSLSQFVCSNTLFVLCGFDEEELDKGLLPVIMGHTPAGASTKQMLHYAQEIKSGKNYFEDNYGILISMLC